MAVLEMARMPPSETSVLSPSPSVRTQAEIVTSPAGGAGASARARSAGPS
jgi:hypothetical protein